MAKTKKAYKSNDLAKTIKEMEMAKKQEAAEKQKAINPIPPVGEEPVISFDAWWAVIVRKIDIRPSYKEVIAADFRGRGLGKTATASAYDKALELYGIKI